MNAIVCNHTMSEDRRIPSNVDYKNNGDVFNTSVGLSTSGILLSSSVSDWDVDRLNPAAYGWVS